MSKTFTVGFKTISGSFTGLFNAPVVPLHINKPLTINVDELIRF
jgi:hypothetical protein